VANEVLVSTDEVKMILKGKKEKEVWEMYVTTYVAWHYFSSKYKLKKLLDNEYILCLIFIDISPHQEKVRCLPVLSGATGCSGELPVAGRHHVFS
jgi:hypothetical protein